MVPFETRNPSHSVLETEKHPMPTPPKPLHEHHLAGTYRADRHAARVDGVIAADPLPEPPNWMQPEAVEEYRRIQRAFARQKPRRAWG